MTLVHVSKGISVAHASMGRWVARCSLCGAGTPPQIRFSTSAFECVECGTVTEIVWPSEKMRQGIERLLMMRPNPVNRNWLPGETLHDLIWENGTHGIYDDLEQLSLDVSPGDVLFGVTDTEIQTDRLPQLVSPPHRRAVDV